MLDSMSLALQSGIGVREAMGISMMRSSLRRTISNDK